MAGGKWELQLTVLDAVSEAIETQLQSQQGVFHHALQGRSVTHM